MGLALVTRDVDGSSGSAGLGRGADPAGDAVATEPTNGEGAAPAASSRAAARGGALNAGGSVLATVLGFGLVLTLTNAYGEVRAGTFFSALALFSICGQTVKLGSDTGLVYALPRLRERGHHRLQHRMVLIALSPTLITSCVVATALIVGSEAIAAALVAPTDAAQRPEYAAVVRGMGWFLPGWALTQTLLGGTRGMGTMLPMSVVQHVGRNLLQFAAIVVAVALGWTGLALGVAWAAPLGVTAAVASVWLTRLLDESAASAAPGSGASEPDVSDMAREFWSFSLPRGAAGAMNVTLEKADVMLVQRLASTADAGVYGAVARLINAGYLIAFSVGQAVAPQFSRLFAVGDSSAAEEIRTLYQTVVGWMVVLVWPVYLVFAVAGSSVLSAFGSEFEVGGTALAITSVGMLAMLMLGPGDFLLLMSGRTWASFVNVGVSLGANLALNRILIPEFGLEGAATAWAIGVVLAAVLPLAQIWSGHGVHPFRRSTILAAGVALVVIGGGMSVVTRLVGDHLLVVILTALALTGVYLAALRPLAAGLQLDRFADALVPNRLRSSA